MYGLENTVKTIKFNTMGLVSVIAVLATIVALILVYKFILPAKRRPRLNKLGQFLHDAFDFKFLIVEKVLQFFYILSTVSVVCYGVAMLIGFDIYRSGYYNRTHWYGLEGIVLAVLGPIAIRLAYEMIMMFILLVKNVMQINKKLKDTEQEAEYQFPSFKELTAKDNFAFVKKSNQAPSQPAAEPQVEEVVVENE